MDMTNPEVRYLPSLENSDLFYAALNSGQNNEQSLTQQIFLQCLRARHFVSRGSLALPSTEDSEPMETEPPGPAFQGKTVNRSKHTAELISGSGVVYGDNKPEYHSKRMMKSGRRVKESLWEIAGIEFNCHHKLP